VSDGQLSDDRLTVVALWVTVACHRPVLGMLADDVLSLQHQPQQLQHIAFSATVGSVAGRASGL